MKRILIIATILIMTTGLIGCGYKKINDFGVKYWTDQETGVEYIIYETCYGCGITPRIQEGGAE